MKRIEANAMSDRKESATMYERWDKAWETLLRRHEEEVEALQQRQAQERMALVLDYISHVHQLEREESRAQKENDHECN